LGKRDRAEKKLRHSEARYRALAGNLNYGICRCSVEGRFLEVNEAMTSMFGYGSKTLASEHSCWVKGARMLSLSPSKSNGSGRIKRP
jgi:PAS domain-containing protein